MIKGFVISLFTAFLWSMIAVVFDRAAKKNLKLYSFYTCGMILGTALSLFFVDWNVLLRGRIERLPELIVIITVSGIANSVSMLLMIKAMKYGHSSLVWALAQSAVVVQFVFATVFWGESINLLQVLGLFSVFLALALTASGAANQPGGQSGNPGKQFLLVLGCFCLIGLSQILFSAPSHWQNWSDNAGLRVPILYVSSCILMVILSARAGERMDKSTALIGLVLAVSGVIGARALLAGLDCLMPFNLSKIVYPIAISGSVVLFSLYSFIILKEPFTPKKWLGVALGAGGIIMLSLK